MFESAWGARDARIDFGWVKEPVEDAIVSGLDVTLPTELRLIDIKIPAIGAVLAAYAIVSMLHTSRAIAL